MKCNTDGRAVSTNKVENLPLVLAPMDIAAILGVSRNTAYELIHSKGFPAFQIGKQYRIQRDKFLVWLDTVSESSVA